MCMNLLRKMDRNKVQFDFVKHTAAVGEYEEEIISLGGRIFEAPRYKIVNHSSYKRWWKRFLTTHNEYQIIHGHYFTISAIYLSVAHKLNLTTIGHVHAMSFVGNINHIVGDVFVHAISGVTDYRFACSKAAGKWAYRDKKFTVLKNAVDTKRFAFDQQRRASMRAQLGVGQDETLFCVVANLSEVKNPIGTIDIFKAIRGKLPAAKLIWAGEGSMHAQLDEKIKAENLSDSAMLLGARSDIPDILQAADVFMLCSFSEGLGLAAIEAQAAGLPCLLSTGVPKEADIASLCTFLRLDDAKAWVEAAEQACRIERKDTREAIIASGYDVQQTADWLTEFYLNCK